MFHVLLGGGAAWARSADVSRPGAFAVPRCPFRHHAAAEPHAVRAASDADLLCAYVWTGDIYGRYWFCADGVESATVPTAAPSGPLLQKESSGSRAEIRAGADDGTGAG